MSKIDPPFKGMEKMLVWYLKVLVCIAHGMASKIEYERKKSQLSYVQFSEAE